LAALLLGVCLGLGASLPGGVHERVDSLVLGLAASLDGGQVALVDAADLVGGENLALDVGLVDARRLEQTLGRLLDVRAGLVEVGLDLGAGGLQLRHPSLLVELVVLFLQPLEFAVHRVLLDQRGLLAGGAAVGT
jgi:hypothetical protein